MGEGWAVPAGLEFLLPRFRQEMAADLAELGRLAGGARDELAAHVHAMRGKCAMFGVNAADPVLAALESWAEGAGEGELAILLDRVVATFRRLGL